MIAIAGGTGRMGRQLAERLVTRGLPVRILTRDPERVPAGLRGRVEVVRADVRDPASLRSALEGAGTVVSAIQGFGGPGAAGARVVDGDGNVALIAAAEAAGAEQFVLLSVLRAAADAPVHMFRDKFRAEQRLRAGSLAWTIVQPTAYMETWVDLVGRPLVETGRTRVFGRGRNPINFVASGDVARIVELAATDPALRGATIAAPGPENLSMDELVATVERVTGRAGRVDHAAPAMMRLLAAVLGVTRPLIADQIRAGLLMDTGDMRVDPAERLARFPSIPMTTLEEVVQRELSPVAEAATAPSPG